jgi:hypothetical protein
MADAPVAADRVHTPPTPRSYAALFINHRPRLSACPALHDDGRDNTGH